MRHTKLKRVLPLVLLLALMGPGFLSLTTAQAEEDNQAPDLPAILSFEASYTSTVEKEAYFRKLRGE